LLEESMSHTRVVTWIAAVALGVGLALAVPAGATDETAAEPAPARDERPKAAAAAEKSPAPAAAQKETEKEKKSTAQKTPAATAPGPVACDPAGNPVNTLEAIVVGRSDTLGTALAEVGAPESRAPAASPAGSDPAKR
jgi:hypothetical protein